MTTILVCGGRTFGEPPSEIDGMGRRRSREIVERERQAADAQRARLGSVLDALHSATPVTALVEGGQRGADRLARAWANERRIPVQTFAPDWHRHGRAAGPIRNRRMIVEGEPEIVIAFPGGKGTQNMVATARSANIEVLLIESAEIAHDHA